MRTVWVVDDDEEMSRAISLLLGVLDYKAVTFHQARLAAQALLSGKRPDLLLLDINMPEVSGLDLLEFVRRRREWSGIPVLMLSTEAADTTVDRALAIGADGYLTKPVTLEELECALHRAFNKDQKGLKTNVQG